MLTTREHLKLYLYTQPKTDLEKKENELSKEIAEKIFLKRMKSLMLDENNLYNKDVLEGDFLAFARTYVHGKARSGKDTEHYKTALLYVQKFAGDQIKFRNIDEHFLERFKIFLLDTTSLHSKRKGLVRNSAASYYDKFCNIVERAFIDNYLPVNPTLKVERISNIEVMRNYLTAEEIELLKASPVHDDIVYKASMFAILTGLRFGAIQSLKWTIWSNQNNWMPFTFISSILNHNAP